MNLSDGGSIRAELCFTEQNYINDNDITSQQVMLHHDIVSKIFIILGNMCILRLIK